eukprot:scaffold735_cov376-Prasinococcus_capsulatus_cf.AAC.3
MWQGLLAFLWPWGRRERARSTSSRRQLVRLHEGASSKAALATTGATRKDTLNRFVRLCWHYGQRYGADQLLLLGAIPTWLADWGCGGDRWRSRVTLVQMGIEGCAQRTGVGLQHGVDSDAAVGGAPPAAC